KRQIRTTKPTSSPPCTPIASNSPSLSSPIPILLSAKKLAFYHLKYRHPKKKNPYRNLKKNDAYAGIRSLPVQEAQEAGNVRRRGLRGRQRLESGAGCRPPRAVGEVYDGPAGAGGAGQVLQGQRHQPPGEVRQLER